jgi:hypothetical protein
VQIDHVEMQSVRREGLQPGRGVQMEMTM